MRYLLVPFLLLSAATPVAADPVDALLGTLSVAHEPNYHDGNLEGCALVYNALMRDSADKVGRLLKIVGNFGLMSMGGKSAIVLKVIVSEFSPQTGALTPLAPIDAYFVWPDFTTSKAARVSGTPSDTPGSYFAIYKFTELEKLFGAIEKSKVTIAYRLKKDGIDQRFDVNPLVVDVDANGQRKRSADAVTDFYGCTVKLIEPLAKQSRP